MSLFKNDHLGIKEKLFVIKSKYHLKLSIKARIKLLTSCLNAVNHISIPRSNEEIELLTKVIKSYDETIEKLEENMRYARKYIKQNGVSIVAFI